ncbi:hypothetical protein LVJ94_01760 [Pendulispora rubella]|uniref:Polyprenyl synthetase n=1 Tax=Pendulispora rubella TaxID=2741070 RepID=A0ABZ2L5E1_9BACT
MAGLADLAITQLSQRARQIGKLLGRADLKELVHDGHEELRARGELALKRYGNAPEPHLEVLAQRVIARKNRDGA